MASITIAADGVEEKFSLDTPAVTLGRGLESDVRLKDIKASRRHCQIVKTPQGFQVLDLSSGNGTYVNGIQIKQQMLNPGDKIQIGTTTITFVDGGAAKPSGGTQRVQAAKAAGAPTTGRNTAAVKTAPVPAAQLPSAPTKKITAKIPVVRPTTQAISKQSTQPLARASTAAIKKTTGRTPTSRSPMSNTEKFRAEARKKKSNPVVMLMVAIGAIFLAVLGFILFSPSGDTNEQFAEDIKKLETEAGVADNAGRLDEAIAKYKMILAKIEGSDKLKSQTVTVKGIIKEIESRKILMGTADKRFNDLKTRYQTVKDEEVNDLHRDAKSLLKDAAESTFPWQKELKEISEKLEKIADTNASIAKRLDFQVIRNELNEKHKLAAPNADFGKAIVDWQAYIADKKVSDENRQKAQNEVNNINLKAKGEVARLKSRAQRMTEEGKKQEAADEMKKQRPRFKDTASAQDLEAIINQLQQ